MRNAVLGLLRALSLVVVNILLLVGRSSASDEPWITESREGCKFPIPLSRVVEHQTVSWSGECVAGYGEGEGQLSWFVDGKPTDSYVGTLHQGREDGKGTARYQSGDQYAGEFYAGSYDGHGIYTFTNGNRYEGDFVAGMSTRHGTLTLIDGQHFVTDLLRGPFDISGPEEWPSFYKDPATLFVVCFTAPSKFDALVLVRSSGFLQRDQYAMSDIRARALKGKKLIMDPIPGCHMVGEIVAPFKGYAVFSNRFANVYGLSSLPLKHWEPGSH